MDKAAPDPELHGKRHRLHEVLFEADTRAGKAFDVALLVCIGVSIVAVCLESVTSIREQHGQLLRGVEWSITVLFSVEYVLRMISIRRPAAYALSFYGLVDLLSILPTYLSLVFAGTQTLLVIRALRLLRVFRVLKLAQFVGEAKQLRAALHASARKIMVFLFTVITVVVIVGAAMYLIEGEASGFTSIPHSMYWAIVTMTTVGYGDLAPITTGGKLLASIVMVLGYGILAVPTGIVTVELAAAGRKRLVSTQACPSCSAEGHDTDARHCKFCGVKL
ncbi:MAG: ion transporter [Planctomycetota bacterium]|nr:MAG: ion transporter [Planctomycetota bacterium]